MLYNKKNLIKKSQTLVYVSGPTCHWRRCEQLATFVENTEREPINFTLKFKKRSQNLCSYNNHSKDGRKNKSRVWLNIRVLITIARRGRWREQVILSYKWNKKGLNTKGYYIRLPKLKEYRSKLLTVYFFHCSIFLLQFVSTVTTLTWPY